MAKKIRGKYEGSLHQRPSGTWRAQISIDGKRVSFGAKTKAECSEWLRRTQHELDIGYDLQGGQMLLSEYLHQWLETCQAQLRPKTVSQYSQTIRKHIIPMLGSIPLQGLKLALIERFYGELIQSGVGVRTVRIIHSILHRALEKAVRYSLINRNPAHGASLPRYKHSEMMIIEEGQVSRFLVAAHGSPYEALYHLAITTGMR